MNADSVCGISVPSLRTFTIPANRPHRAGLLSIPSCPQGSQGETRRFDFLTLPGYCVLLIVSLIGTCGVARAGSGNTAVSDAGVLQVVLGLGFVLALMAGLAWLLRRFGGMQQRAAGAIKILGGAAVGQRERVVLVEIADTWLIIGVASGHVSALHSMPKGEIRENPGEVGGNARFSARLRQAVGQMIEKQTLEKQTIEKHQGERHGE